MACIGETRAGGKSEYMARARQHTSAQVRISCAINFLAASELAPARAVRACVPSHDDASPVPLAHSAAVGRGSQVHSSCSSRYRGASLSSTSTASAGDPAA